MSSILGRLFLTAAVISLAAGGARAEGVALTFDDLPTLSLTDDTAYARATTLKLVKGLRRHHLPAIGFVVGDKLEGADRPARQALLKIWLRAGYPLGNHTYDHESLSTTPLAEYIQNVERNEAVKMLKKLQKENDKLKAKK